MQPFDYYIENPYKLPDRFKWRQDARRIIDNTPMTVAEREAAYAGMSANEREWFQTASKDHREFETARKEEFWRDCRTDMGYCEWLTTKGIELVENKAWEDGHADGYSNVHTHLEMIIDFLRDMRPHIKPV